MSTYDARLDFTMDDLERSQKVSHALRRVSVKLKCQPSGVAEACVRLRDHVAATEQEIKRLKERSRDRRRT